MFDTHMTGSRKMDVSVLICTHNSAQKIRETLLRLRDQSDIGDCEWEVILVDYESTDGTIGVAQAAWLGMPNRLIVIRETRQGKSPALEAGFWAANGEAVCIIDDDNWVDRNYIITAHKIISSYPDVGLVGAYGIPEFESSPPPWFHMYQGVFAVGHQAQAQGYIRGESRRWFWGAGSVIRRSAWRKASDLGFRLILNPSRDNDKSRFIKGFAGGEDQEIAFVVQLLGYRLWYEPNLIYWHFLTKSRLTERYLIDASMGAAMAIPVLRLYLSYMNHSGIKGKVRSIIYRNLGLMLIHEVYLSVVASVRSLRKNGVRTLEQKRIIFQFLGFTLGLLNIRRKLGMVIDQINNISKADRASHR